MGNSLSQATIHQATLNDNRRSVDWTGEAVKTALKAATTITICVTKMPLFTSGASSNATLPQLAVKTVSLNAVHHGAMVVMSLALVLDVVKTRKIAIVPIMIFHMADTHIVCLRGDSEVATVAQVVEEMVNR